MHKIALAESVEEILNCFSLMSELRPHLQAEDFLPRVKKLNETTELYGSLFYRTAAKSKPSPDSERASD